MYNLNNLIENGIKIATYTSKFKSCYRQLTVFEISFKYRCVPSYIQYILYN